MLYREIMAVCSQIHTKHINALCGQNVELLKVEAGGLPCFCYEDARGKHRLELNSFLTLELDGGEQSD